MHSFTTRCSVTTRGPLAPRNFRDLPAKIRDIFAILIIKSQYETIIAHAADDRILKANWTYIRVMVKVF